MSVKYVTLVTNDNSILFFYFYNLIFTKSNHENRYSKGINCFDQKQIKAK